VTRVQLVCWKEAEGRERVRALRAAGLSVAYEPDGAAALRAVREELPDVVVIDLGRLPSHGRALALTLRQSKRTRRIPLVFLGGAGEKLARIRGELPDATYAAGDSAAEVVRAIERAAAAPPAEPVVPRLAPLHTDKPLAAKLGWKGGATLALVGAPDGFERTLGAPPTGAKLVRALRGRCDLVLWFVRSEKELARALPRWLRAAEAGTRVWVGWPKKGSRVATDLTGERVRTAPHALGLVDFKICALDAVWSAVCFARRKS
jgi:CheY-like chemotaxis protein